MIKRLQFIAAIFLFGLLLFTVFRVTFLAYHFHKFMEVADGVKSGILIHGFYSDIPATAWFTFMPLMLMYSVSIFSGHLFKRLNRFIVISVIFITSLVTIADVEVFRSWGTRMDATVIRYLTTPSEAYAASNAAPFLLLSLIFFITFASMTFIYLRFIDKLCETLAPVNKKDFIALPFYLAFLLIAGRGGLQQIPVNISFSFFSTDDFANQSAINQSQQFFYSLWLKYKKDEKPFNLIDKKEAGQIIEMLYQSDNQASYRKILKTERPNIILILWESLTGKAASYNGCIDNVIPEFDKLAQEGVLFSNFYASGDRTSKGLPAVLSGYPAQPGSPIIMNSTKIKSLPSLGKTLRNAGYATSFYYGGDLEFDNMKVFLTRGGFSRLIGRNNFPASLTRSKWGAHDHDVLNMAAKDLKSEKQPFFSCILTLSSHEPFEIPVPAKFPGKDTEAMFKSSLHYTDHSIAHFINCIKQEPWYENTLVIITADHGTPIIGEISRFHPDKFRIPMLLLGGALTQKGITIDTTGSQQDIPATILSQTGLCSKDYKFSRNLLKYGNNYNFANLIFNDGITLVTDKGFLAFDNRAKAIIHQGPGLSERDVRKAQALMQETFQDYLNR